jgi:hypothetical protein
MGTGGDQRGLLEKTSNLICLYVYRMFDIDDAKIEYAKAYTLTLCGRWGITNPDDIDDCICTANLILCECQEKHKSGNVDSFITKSIHNALFNVHARNILTDDVLKDYAASLGEDIPQAEGER